MNIDVLVSELQQNYYLVKEAVSKMKFDNLQEYDLFLSAAFRTAWGSSWSKAGKDAQRANTSHSSGSPGSSTMTTPSTATNASFTVPGEPKLAELADPHQGSASGAQAFLASLLRTHALTKSQYIALCRACNLTCGARPKEEDVMRLDFEACVAVLCGGR